MDDTHFRQLTPLSSPQKMFISSSYDRVEDKFRLAGGITTGTWGGNLKVESQEKLKIRELENIIYFLRIK